MNDCTNNELAITGIGITSSVGQGKKAFLHALMEGRHAFGVMQRPGRQRETAFLGAEIASFDYPSTASQADLRNVSLSAQAALVTVYEAWDDAGLGAVDPSRIGLVVGGCNVQQRELVRTYERYGDRLHFLRPTYGLCFMDTDICGLCTEHFGIKGTAYTVGGASASGHLAILQAAQAIQTGQIDVAIAVGALMDLSYWECQGLRSLGAMGSDRFSDQPAMASRPFDRDRDGFIFGESCGALVIERLVTINRSRVRPYGILSGWATVMDGNRLPDPSFEGEVKVISNALEHAHLKALDIDYVNPHGTGSVIGDEIELNAILACRLYEAHINATKSITGHGLTAAGTVEVIATLLQMEAGRLHPSRNLDNPIRPQCKWVTQHPISHRIKHALNLSIGFGGLNTAICLSSITAA
jgi:malonyl-ACP decarboxylase